MRAEFICRACKEEKWANEIEEIMGIYMVSFKRAKEVVAMGNQAICLSCGDAIPRGTKGRSLFCSKSKCKSASRRVKHLRLYKGLSKQDALEQVLNEIQQKAA